MRAKEFLKEYGPWSDAPHGKPGSGKTINMDNFREVNRRPFQRFTDSLEKDWLRWTDLRGGTQNTLVWFAPGTKDIVAMQPTSSSGSTTPARYVRKDQVVENAAGTLTRQNTTADVKKGTLKKQGRKFGFDITDGGIPPRISKDSIKKS